MKKKEKFKNQMINGCVKHVTNDFSNDMFFKYEKNFQFLYIKNKKKLL